MAEWGKPTEHERFVALQEQVRRIKGEGYSTTAGLVKDEAWYRAMADDTTLPAKQRAQWKALADELATRLGYNSPPTKQEELSFDETDDRST